MGWHCRERLRLEWLSPNSSAGRPKLALQQLSSAWAANSPLASDMTGLGHLGLGPLESISTCLERGRVAKLMQPPVLRRAVLGARCDFQLNRPSRVDPQAVAIYSVRHVSQTNGPPPHGLPLSVIVRHGPKSSGLVRHVLHYLFHHTNTIMHSIIIAVHSTIWTWRTAW